MKEWESSVRSGRLELVLLLAILLVALALRLWGIGFGLPYEYHFDEPTYVSAALNLGAGIIGCQPNPTGFSNILFGEYAFYFVLGRVLGAFASVAEFELAYRADPSIFLILGRITSAILGVMSVLAVYWIGREMRGRLTGLLASFFLAVAFLHVRDSHFAVPDAAMTAFVILTALLCALAAERETGRCMYLAAASGGFAIATKWSAWPVIIPLALTVFFVWRSRHREKSTRDSLARLLAPAAFFVGGFLVGGFQLVLEPKTYLSYALHEWQAGEAGGFGIWQVDSTPGWVFYINTLSCGLGVGFLALAGTGIAGRLASVFRRRDSMSFIILSFPLLYFLIMGSTRHYFARYALPLIPFLGLFAAEAVGILAEWMARRQRWLGWGLSAALILWVVAQPLAWSTRHDFLLTREDSRTLAKEWIEANVPADSKIGLDWPVHGPPLSTPDEAASGSSPVYDVVIVGGTGLSDHSVEWYSEQGFGYLVASSFIYDIPLVYEEQNAARRAFYASLDQHLTLVHEIRPYDDREPSFVFDEIYGPIVSLWQRERPGPTIKIYQVNP